MFQFVLYLTCVIIGEAGAFQFSRTPSDPLRGAELFGKFLS